MKLPAAERKRPTLWDIALSLLVVLAAGLIFLALRPSGGNFLTAAIVLDGETVAEYRLSEIKEAEILRLEDAPWPVTIEMEPGRIRIAESACPSQDCVHTGWADKAGDEIICLPNRLVISLTGSDAYASEFDSISG